MYWMWEDTTVVIGNLSIMGLLLRNPMSRLPKIVIAVLACGVIFCTFMAALGRGG